MTSRVLLAAALALLCLSAPARAASFDCAKASSPREKSVCSDEDLSKADEEIAAQYASALKRLSAEGAERLRGGQRSWLAFLGKACPAGGVECLEAWYEERVTFLRDAVKEEGGNTYLVSDEWHFISPAKDGEEEIVGADDIRYRQQLHFAIDAPEREGERAFNTAIEQHGDDLWTGFDGEMRMDTHIALNGATVDLASADLFIWQFPLGAAHGFGAAVHVNFLLNEGRPLRAEDLFVRDGWEEALAEEVLAGLRANEDLIFFDGLEETVRGMAAKSENWVLTKEGLGVNFPVYSIGPYAMGDLTITVPWGKLESWLAESAPFAR
ncbi:DUF3298 domain-containing protein [Parvibaculum sp.]|uniref:DUF3298 domain-containing protein n=1 Tax=Parvibaculum sp. TaxID=2024848 RepID=UPI001B08741E|nr:DUF3298 domain-containing protein [Parvibaculum sp.]MBO6635223.1 DUF3298 domain-containing protein [Parvibaculum sp.]MBO6677526.1 DUF3298 domain-containing protein [Parvibaculum sp.]MBO6685876.1 DUF3298 domain-containing protein [Parvibaculum sp.]MBO6905249.1 DUF3298 domain-containing protein [Parvibaculum sp.]